MHIKVFIKEYGMRCILHSCTGKHKMIHLGYSLRAIITLKFILRCGTHFYYVFHID